MALEEIIQSTSMKVIIDKSFPSVVTYHLAKDVFSGQIRSGKRVKINGTYFVPEVSFTKVNESTAEYLLKFLQEDSVIELTVKLQVVDNQLWFNVTNINHQADRPIESIEFPDLDLVSIGEKDHEAKFSGARMSTNTHISGDTHLSVNKDLKPFKEGYMYAFVASETLVAAVWSNSHYSIGKSSYKDSTNDHLRLAVTAFEAGEGMTLSISSSAWHYQRHDKGIPFPATTLELPAAKVIIARDLNNDQVVDWQDGAIAYREIMNHPYGHERVPDLVAQRIVMNFGSQAPNPFLSTLDGIKKVYLHTDGLGQSLLLKGYGSEGHDSAHLNYEDVGEKIGGVKDFKTLLKEAATYHASLGVHINVTETYPESPYFVEELLKHHEDGSYSYGWNWLDQAIDIDSGYDLAHDRNKRFEAFKAIVEDDLEFIYVDVWGNGQSGDESAWPSHQLAKQLNELGWRFAVEWSHSGEYDATWHHWAVDLPYGGYQLKGINSAITRFIRHHQKDAWVGDMESYGGAANYPLLGGYSLLSFEGWQGHNHYDKYIENLFLVNLPTKYLQHYQVMRWEFGETVTLTDHGETYEWTPEMKVHLQDESGTKVEIKRQSNQPDEAAYRRRIITENQRQILTNDAYLLAWKWDADGQLLAPSDHKLYYYSINNHKTTWDLPDNWQNQPIYLYQLTELGRQLQGTIETLDGQLTLELEAKTPYVMYLTPQEAEDMNWSQGTHLVDQAFNSGSLAHWYIEGNPNDATITRSARGNTRLTIKENKQRVSLSQELSDLKANTQYAAYVGLENMGDVSASLSVSGGNKEVSNQTRQSLALNYVKAHPHSTDPKDAQNYQQSHFQNLFVFFTTGSESKGITLTLAREAGSGYANFDGIRVVENNSLMFDGQHDSLEARVFSQNFEQVAQGIYPFVVAGAEDVEDNRIHLSELNAPYTQRGWNGKKISDVINGRWSLKINGLTGKEALLIQTIPQTVTFEANEHYRVSFTYEAGWDDSYSFVIGEGAYEASSKLRHTKLKNTWQTRETAKRVSFDVHGASSGQTWIGIYSTDIIGKEASDELPKGDVNFRSYNDFVLDDLVIEKVSH